MPTRIATLVLAVVLASGCATLSDGEDDAESDPLADLVEIEVEPGTLLVDPMFPVDGYDDMLFEFRIDRPSGFSKNDLERMHDQILREELARMERLGERELDFEPGPCTAILRIRVTDVDLVRTRGAGSSVSFVQSFGDATTIIDVRDSTTDRILQSYEQRRRLPGGTMGGSRAEFQQLGNAVRSMIAVSREVLEQAVPFGPVDSRAALGCNGTIGRYRRGERVGS